MTNTRQFILLGLLTTVAAPAMAAETITYKYDAKGRLIEVKRSGSVNNNVQSTYTHDKANNRKNTATSGSANTPPPGTPPPPPPPPPASSFSIGNVSTTEGLPFGFAVTRSGSTSTAATVNYATANGTAVSPSDYTATSGTLSFAAGETSKTVTVYTVHDLTIEANETFFVNLSGATGGATISGAQGTGTIPNDDEPLCGGVPC